MAIGGLVLDLTPLRVSPPFRALYAARLSSLLVYGVQTVSMSLQLYGLTGSAAAVGLLSVVTGVPMALSLAFGGILADRSDRRSLILAARSAYVVAVLLLLGNTLRSDPAAWPIYAAAVVGGIAGGISVPALMAATPALVGRENLPAAAALGSIAAQAGALGGPALAGLLVARFGYAACYGVVAVGATLTVILLRRLPPLPRASEGASATRVVGQFREGLGFALGAPLILGLLLADTVATLLATPFAVLPKFGAEALGIGAGTLGLLFSASALGSLLAALASGWLRSLTRPGLVLLACIAGWGSAASGLGLAPNVVAAGICLVLLGAADTWSEIIRGFLIQRHTPDRLLGRVSSIWVMQATLAPALGNLLVGSIAEHLPVRSALLIGGASCVAATFIVFFTSTSLRAARSGQEGVPSR